jgi:predicted Zn-dependent protease
VTPPPATQPPWRGWYLDGQTPERRGAVVDVHAGGLRITADDGSSRVWWFCDVRQAQGFYRGEPIRLEHGDEDGGVLIVDDPAFAQALHGMSSPGVLRGRRLREGSRMGVVVASVAAALVLAVALYRWGVPIAAAALTAAVPVHWEEQLGEHAFALLAASNRPCTDPRLEAAIADITTRLTRAVPHTQYRFRVVVLDIADVNALALPGGRVIVFRGLLAMTDSPEMLAGVLGHEFQHVLRRHATRAIVRQAAMSGLISALTQDARWVARALGGASVFGALQYGRAAEEEADREGLRMLQAAGIDQQGMVAFFRKMAVDDDSGERAGSSPWWRLFATHPAATSRVDTLSALATTGAPRPSPLPQTASWDETRALCEGP